MVYTVYRGIAIYYEGQEQMYYCTVDGKFRERSTLSALKNVIDNILDEPEPEPEPDPVDEWVYHSTYRGIRIEKMVEGSWVSYRAYLDGQWWSSTSLSTVHGYIDDYLEPEPEPEKKPTTLTINVYPTSGTPPYDVMITVELRSNGVALANKYVSIYKNDSLLTSGNTDSGGKLERSDTVTVASSYYAYWAGDSQYEGCDTRPGAGLGGLGLIILLALIFGGK